MWLALASLVIVVMLAQICKLLSGKKLRFIHWTIVTQENILARAKLNLFYAIILLKFSHINNVCPPEQRGQHHEPKHYPVWAMVPNSRWNHCRLTWPIKAKTLVMALTNLSLCIPSYLFPCLLSSFMFSFREYGAITSTISFALSEILSFCEWGQV